MTLTDNGKDWLARNAGVNNCFASSGVSYKDLEGNSHTGSTTDVAAMLVVAALLGYPYTTKEIVNGKTYDDFKSANGDYDLEIDDVGTVYEEQEKTPPYCAAVATPTPTPTPTPTVTPTPSPTPTPVPNAEVCAYVESAGKGNLTWNHVLALRYEYLGLTDLAESKRQAIPEDKRPASIPSPISWEQYLGVRYYYLELYSIGDAKLGCGWSE